MAKPNKPASPIIVDETQDWISVAIPKDWSTEAHGHTITAAMLNPAVVSYLLRNGFTQSITDAGALGKGDIDKELAKPGAGTRADVVTAMQASRRDAKFRAILDGTVGTRTSGPRATPRDKVLRAIALEALRGAVVKAKALGKVVKLPDGEKLDALIANYLEKNTSSANAEADRRMASGGDVDLDALME